jgi:two-component sensor histidine kinase
LNRALEYIIPSPKGAGVAPEHTLKGLLRTLLTPYEEACRNTPRFVIEGDDTPVGSHATTSLALSIHELATNAVKYGALVEPAGSVTVTIRCQGGECEITWTERGGPPVGAPPDRSGFGSLLLQRSIAGPLGGYLTWDWRREGLSLRLVAPLALLGR